MFSLRVHRNGYLRASGENFNTGFRSLDPISLYRAIFRRIEKRFPLIYALDKLKVYHFLLPF